MSAEDLPGPARLEALERELGRVVERVRLLALARLAEPAPPWPSRADAARAVAQLLADLAQDVEEGPSAGPERRMLPHVHDAASGDQLAVTGHDLVLVDARAPASVIQEAIDALVDLRHAL